MSVGWADDYKDVGGRTTPGLEHGCSYVAKPMDGRERLSCRVYEAQHWDVNFTSKKFNHGEHGGHGVYKKFLSLVLEMYLCVPALPEVYSIMS